MRLGIGLVSLLVLLASCGPSQAERDAEARRIETERIDREAREKAARDAEAARLAQEERQRQVAAAQACIRNSFLSTGVSRTPQETARLIRGIDTSGCPTEYRAAYDAHMYAWSDYAEIKSAQQQLRDQAPLALLAEIAARLSEADARPAESYAEVADQLQALAVERNDRIGTTYREIRRIALLYDVTPP